MLLLLLLAAAFVPMVLEAGLAARHDRLLRARGALEPAADVYAVMQVVYPASFALMAFEGWFGGATVDAMFAAGMVLIYVTGLIHGVPVASPLRGRGLQDLFDNMLLGYPVLLDREF